MSIFKTLLLASAVVLGASDVHAQQEAQGLGIEEKPSLWGATDDKAEKFRALMQEADDLALDSIQYDTPPQDRAGLAEKAMRAYEAASELNPESPEPHFRAAMVSNQFATEANFPAPRALDRAIAHLEAFENLAALDPRLPSVYFQRSILRTKRDGKENLEKGVADYESQLALIDQSAIEARVQTGIILSNRAELLMMLGRLEESIASYEQALEFGDAITHGYGLAVALDRDGQGFRARQVARKFALMDTGNALGVNGTFYTPAGEVFYYEAIRAESLANYRLAETAYRAFLQRLPNSQFAPQARKNLEAVKPKAKSQPAPKRPRLPVIRRPF
tara:strand:+ start:29419 stop:30417 length:999 start_codon:yes stop_codon:yes gene_type:complete